MSQGRETTSPDSLRGTFINGSRENAKNYSVDGITDLDTGSNNTLQFEPNMDAIAEVKVLTSNFQAEYGRNGGGVITVITRGGGKDFHVAAYDTYRHESLNANSFWNNRRVPRRTRINRRTATASPATMWAVRSTFPESSIPSRTSCSSSGTRNTRAAQGLWNALCDHADGGRTQRRFLQERHRFGHQITITDPLTNGVQFPAIIVPKNRFSTLGLAMLNFLPMPNYTDLQADAGE